MHRRLCGLRRRADWAKWVRRETRRLSSPCSAIPTGKCATVLRTHWPAFPLSQPKTSYGFTNAARPLRERCWRRSLSGGRKKESLGDLPVKDQVKGAAAPDVEDAAVFIV